MVCWSAGRRVAATADLAGEDAPALLTVGKDGAVFYWMYDPAPPDTHPTPQGYAQVHGKHRKRKAPDTDPIQPNTAAANGNRGLQKKGLSDSEHDERDSHGDTSGDVSSGSSEGGEAVGVEQSRTQAAGADSTEDAAEILASTSEATEDQPQRQQQEQTMSFASEWLSSPCCVGQLLCLVQMQAAAASACFYALCRAHICNFLSYPSMFMRNSSPALPFPAIPCSAPSFPQT